ncbi:MAG TPA: hypothetical protein VFX50_15180 [Gemmatimonadales bacterium]|nr:hypothetical protein [Gemmatimonadales bacterium]
MPVRPHAVPVLLVLLLGTACSNDDPTTSPSGYPIAYATNACGPADGPATRLYLTADSVDGLPSDVPRIEIGIYKDVSELQGRSFSLGKSTADGWAGRCPAQGTCETAESADVTFRRSAADTLLSGTVQLRFPDGTTVSGGFHAEWRRTQQLCG